MTKLTIALLTLIILLSSFHTSLAYGGLKPRIDLTPNSVYETIEYHYSFQVTQ